MEPKATTKVYTIFFTMFTFLSLSSLMATSPSSSSNNITAIFAFGDSISDTGNNNYLLTIYRANFPPYGRDFPLRIPTGRFTNGKLLIDFIISSLGLKYLLPPYFNVIADYELLTGVSFASANSGLDPLTAQVANVLNVSTQLDLFNQTLTRITRLVGAERARSTIQNALFFISIGTDDVIYNFYNSNLRSSQFTISSYQDFLLQNLESTIQRLYNTGARRFVVTSLPPVGCLPIQVTLSSNGTSQRLCVEQQNRDSIAFNIKLRLLASRLETQLLQGSKVAYYDVYNPLLDMINNPAKYGFEQTLRGCCGTGLYEFGLSCNVTTPTCPDTSKYIFWDAVHPSQVVYTKIANIAIQTVIPHVLG